jgi:putative sterol carrier protein
MRVDPRIVRSDRHAYSVDGFLRGLPLGFQRHAAAGLDAVLQFRLWEPDAAAPRVATVVIRDGALTVAEGVAGKPHVTVEADAETWLEFLRGERGLLGALLRRRIRVRGSLAKLRGFARCFPR